MFTTPVEHLSTLTDAFGAPLVDYHYVAADQLLFLHWHGHLTAAEIIRVAQAAGQLRPQRSWQRILNDKRGSSGDWAEALPFMLYEWMPNAVAHGIRAMADLISPDVGNRVASEAFIRGALHQLPTALFTNEAEALRWIRSK